MIIYKIPSFFCSILFITSAVAQNQDRSSLEVGLEYETGRAIFEKVWVSAPASTTASDGLGPFYNARSCSLCHAEAGRGRVDSSLVLQINDEVYGEQIQSFAVPGLRAEATVEITYSEISVLLAEGESVLLHQPEYSFSALQYGAIVSPGFSPRLAPSLSGIGLLELIPVQAIENLADENDQNGDGISGRVNFVWDIAQQKQSPGRFGWKAGQPSIAQQNAKALNLDIGISNYLFPNAWGDCTKYQVECLIMPTGNSPQHDDLEASSIMMDSLLSFTRNIPAPRPGNLSDSDVSAGAMLFNKAGCDGCHHPEFSLPGQIIRPWSDLLLHDMGQGLADNRPEAMATGFEWRTAPLWGIGHLDATGTTGYLHDGRAGSLEEAILWHGGEAETAKNRYISMPKPERDNLIKFLKSL